MGCFGEVQAGRSNGGNFKNAIRGEYGEVTVMMSTQENSLQEVPAEICATTDIVGVQMKTKGPEEIFC